MRRRITFIQPPNAPFSPDQAVLTPDALSITNLDAVREERLTVSYDELPDEIRTALDQYQAIHIRWATEHPHHAPAPFASRVSSGLHVFVSGEKRAEGEDALCPLLKRMFGEVDCLSTEKSFIEPPVLSKRFSSTADLYYYSPLSFATPLVDYIQNNICAKLPRGSDASNNCIDLASSLFADTFDISYDSISHALTVSAVSSRAPGEEGWTQRVAKLEGNSNGGRHGIDQVEVGLLTMEKAADAEDIKMGGLLGVVGKDEKLNPTMFSFPSRHHALPDDATYLASFSHPKGLHPTMTLSLSPSALKEPPAPADATCALHTYLTLPSSIFGDKYQLSTTDPLFLQSHNLAALRAVFGETDLEAPDWAVDRWGSNWLLELATPENPDEVTGEWNVTIPLHLRYLPPSESGYRTIRVPWPVVFWACTAEGGTKMGINPFDRVNLGWEGLFGPRTMFYQVHPGDEDVYIYEKVTVPVLQLDEKEGLFRSKTIELGTVTVIVLGFLWVLWKLGLVVSSSSGKKSKQRKTE